MNKPERASKKVILDTDIGSDIDDAVCLAYLLANPNCDLAGITTVSGEPEKRAMIASALCTAAGRKIPVFPGAENPLMVPQRQPHAPQAEKLPHWPHENSFPKGEAVEFMRRTIHDNPAEINLIAIGPMTNVALLFSADPEIPSLLQSLTLMLGRFMHYPDAAPVVEWNAQCDPHAASIVYRAKVRAHRSIGLDVTLKAVMDADAVREKFNAPMLKPVADFAEVWFAHTAKQMVFHDPLAASTLFDESICGFERGSVEVELQSEKLAGMTLWRKPAKEAAPHQAAASVDVKRFFTHYFSFFNGGEKTDD